MKKQEIIRAYFEQSGGILPLIPVFVPRRFGKAGRRLRLHPDDYYALGTKRGSIKERWFSSVITAMNGENAAADEGMSYVDMGEGHEPITLKDFVAVLKGELVGDGCYVRHGTWPMYSKFFDYEGPLFHHMHLGFEDAARVGKIGKPEAYYFPPQYNNYPGSFPHTYFGFSPEVTREEIRERLANFTKEDTRITEISRAYRIELGTGWYTAPGVVHAPGSYLTYEPQWNSDVNAVFENITAGEVYGEDFLYENVPDELKGNPDAILDMMDWEKNVDPDYKKHYFRPPVVLAETDAYVEKHVVYDNPYVEAKELTVYPGCEVCVPEETAYGCIVVQGYGMLDEHPCAVATMLRFGQKSEDEFFVSARAAKAGIRIKNNSKTDPLVLLKHYPAIHTQQ